jgi:hypothetical protein
MRTVYIFMIASLASALASAQDHNWHLFMQHSATAEFASGISTLNQIEEPASGHAGEYKSIPKAAFMSAVLPGLGQWYSGSKLKAALFLSIEAAAWTYYGTQKKKGNDIRTEFRAYANTHWSENEYYDWIAMHSGLDRNDLDMLKQWEEENFSHHLHEERDQQFYEMIGKYDQFNSAWDDSDIGVIDEGWSTALRSKHRLYYEGRRNAHNAALKDASFGLTVVMLNHLLSGAEAAWTVSRHNKQQAKASIGLVPKYIDNQQYTALNLRIDW